MPQRFRVKLDLAVIRKHLSREEGRAVNAQQTKRWLQEAGFAAVGTEWEVNEPDLGQVQPSEVLEIHTVQVKVSTHVAKSPRKTARRV
jgi:hypothetical protein